VETQANDRVVIFSSLSLLLQGAVSENETSISQNSFHSKWKAVVRAVAIHANFRELYRAYDECSNNAQTKVVQLKNMSRSFQGDYIKEQGSSLLASHECYTMHSLISRVPIDGENTRVCLRTAFKNVSGKCCNSINYSHLRGEFGESINHEETPLKMDNFFGQFFILSGALIVNAYDFKPLNSQGGHSFRVYATRPSSGYELSQANDQIFRKAITETKPDPRFAVGKFEVEAFAHIVYLAAFAPMTGGLTLVPAGALAAILALAITVKKTVGTVKFLSDAYCKIKSDLKTLDKNMGHQGTPPNSQPALTNDFIGKFFVKTDDWVDDVFFYVFEDLYSLLPDGTPSRVNKEGLTTPSKITSEDQRDVMRTRDDQGQHPICDKIYENYSKRKLIINDGSKVLSNDILEISKEKVKEIEKYIPFFVQEACGEVFPPPNQDEVYLLPRDAFTLTGRRLYRVGNVVIEKLPSC